MTAVEDFAALQAKEYGTYVATSPIFLLGVRAFNPGDPVPVSHVEQYGYDAQGLVRLVGEPLPEVVPPPVVPLPVGEPVVVNPT
jgi:hypothetical protein